MPKISTTYIPAISTTVSADEPTNPRKATFKGNETLDRGSLEGSQSKSNKGDFMQ